MSTYVSQENTSVILEIENFVVSTNRSLPLLGNDNFNYETVNFRWDREFLQSWSSDAFHYNTYIGGHSDSLFDGTIDQQWQSGSINGIDYLGINYIRHYNTLAWSPVIQTGTYTIFNDLMYLYSNYSFFGRVVSLEDSQRVIELEEDCDRTSIEVTLFYRDERFTKRPYRRFTQVEEFTSDIPNRKYEYKIIDDKVIVNSNHTIEVGQNEGEITLDIIRGLCEESGPGSGSGRLIYSKYFPFSDEGVAVFAVDSSGNIEELIAKDTLDFSGPDDLHCLVDKDLGIITIGGYKAPDLVLSQNVSAFDTTIEFYPNDNVSDSYPSKGIIEINGEKILYYWRDRTTFYECVRGYDGTIPTDHTILSRIEDTQHGKSYSSDTTFYIKYISVPAIRYEISEHTKRVGTNINLKPSRHVITNKIVQISSVEKNVASVVLETSSPIIGGSIYGPIYYGTDFSQLCATVYDSYGNVVEDIETYITIEEEWIGYLNGNSRTYTAWTNAEGQICCLYHAPYNWDDISLKITDIRHEGSDTIFGISGRPPGILPESVTVFQVLKHDPIMGTVGKKVTCIDGSASLFTTIGGSLIGYSSFDVEISSADSISSFEDGYVDVVVNGTKYRRTVLEVIPQFDSDGNQISMKIILLDTIPGITDPGALSYAWLLEPDANEWNSFTLNGVNVVLYEWNASVPHPITGDLGAYYPVRPDEVSSTELVFKNRLLPMPDATDPDSNLGGYVVVIPNLVKIKAYAKDPVSGRLIASNSIRLSLDLPAYLNGVDKSNSALPIPYGFTFITEDFNVGSGIGGSNFITINPRASGISSYSLFITPVSRGH